MSFLRGLLFGLLTSSEKRVSALGRVERVLDGDTADVMFGDNRLLRIRITGIDAPEIGQPVGEESREWLARLIAGRLVTATSPYPEWRTDPFGRTVAALEFEGHDVGAVMIRSGLAHPWIDAPERYHEASYTAIREGLGVWRDSTRRPELPWHYRQRMEAKA